MPGQLLNIFVKGFEGKSSVIQIEEDASIAQLFEKLKDVTNDADDIRVIYGTKDLRALDERGKALTLKDYKIFDDACICVVLRLRGGSNENGTEQPKMYPAEIELTDDPDMITLENEKGLLRAKMPCGHAIGPVSLNAYCKSLLSVGKYEFRCPGVSPSGLVCNYPWEFFTVKRVAFLTPEDIKQFEVKVCENYLRQAVRIQECPNCKSFCERISNADRRVICQACTKRAKGKLYEFCWYCLNKWLGSGTKDCGNSSCKAVDPRLPIIQNCPKITVIGVPNCPAIRACPRCGLLIEHIEKCKHMDCPCGQKFCFICLKKADSNGKYQCGTFKTKCEVAAIQTTIPGK